MWLLDRLLITLVDICCPHWLLLGYRMFEIVVGLQISWNKLLIASIFQLNMINFCITINDFVQVALFHEALRALVLWDDDVGWGQIRINSRFKNIDD